MAQFSSQQCKEVWLALSHFLSDFAFRLSRDISKYFKSFVGRDFKTLAELVLFVLPTLLTPGEAEVWLALSKVHVCATHLYMCLLPTYPYRCSSLYILSGLHLTRSSP